MATKKRVQITDKSGKVRNTVVGSGAYQAASKRSGVIGSTNLERGSQYKGETTKGVGDFNQQDETVKFDPYSGQELSAGESFQDQNTGQTFMQGEQFNPKVNTGQPSPQTVQAQPFTSSSQITQPSQQGQATISPYQQGFNQMKGQTAPQDSGAAIGKVQNAIPTPAQDTSVIDSFFQQDPMINDIISGFNEYFSPKNQRESLTQEYARLTQESGIEALDTELMDMKNVIEGAEDDIRNEITKAGGFATESQVMALTNSRNKQLIKNYNNLLETRNTKQSYLDKMMDLSSEDRKMADDMFDRNINFAFKIEEAGQRMKSNAENSLNRIVNQVGYQGLAQMTGGDPYYTSLVENTLGLGQGGLERLAEYTPPMSEMDALDLENKKLQNQKLRQDINGSGSSGISDTTQVIINNPSLFDDLTPTEKGKVITQLQAGGYDTSNLGVKGLSDTAIKEVSQTQSALDDIQELRKKIEDNKDLIGPLKGLAKISPFSKQRKIQADIDRVKQTVGKALEGGVLRKEDEEKYKKILATITDTPSTALYKIDALIGAISRNIEDYKGLQQSGGRSLDITTPLQKVGETTSIEDLRSKYNY